MADQLITGTTLIEDKRRDEGKVWSITGNSFIPAVATDTYDNFDTGSYQAQTVAAGGYVVAGVHLPHGTTIKAVVVNGSNTARTWKLNRKAINSNGVDSTLATAVIGTEDTSITNDVVDNNAFAYWLVVESLALNEDVYAARIIYD